MKVEQKPMFTYKDGYEGTHFKETRPATTAEIMDAHPKCKDCSSNNKEEYGVSWCYVFDVAILDPDNYYCRHWEGKQ